MTMKSIKILTEDRNYWKNLCSELSDKSVELEIENKRLREALEEICELSKHDNQSRYLDKCYVVARKALEGTE